MLPLPFARTSAQHTFPTSQQGGDEDAIAIAGAGEPTSGNASPLLGPPARKLSRRNSMLNSLKSRLRRGGHNEQQQQMEPVPPLPRNLGLGLGIEKTSGGSAGPPLLRRRSSNPELVPKGPRNAIAGLPRPQTFHRRESEERAKLLEVPPREWERRAKSLGRRRGWSASAFRRTKSPPPVPGHSGSAPEVSAQGVDGSLEESIDHRISKDEGTGSADIVHGDGTTHHDSFDSSFDSRNEHTDNEENEFDFNDVEDQEIDQATLREEFDRCWILNLSMSFRDKSQREKFFVTYAENRTKWRRLTISLDYRHVVEGSLEADLKSLHYQRDKSFRIYEAIRESLDDIQFYDTVTNLKLETTEDDCQLHVHVREDANEIIHFPKASLMRHVDAKRFRESDLEFDSHLSGFVYKVRVDDRVLIKKEIPGPDTVDEFLYEVNALDSLVDSEHVVQLQGLVTNDEGNEVKGLLISYASRGSLVDMIYDYPGQLSWERRVRWARQIVQGLSDVHEAGYVQGDFTLSNIVIDDRDDAYIIDINRRGCPVGWEPPELSTLIESGQRIAMHISVKTDLFQLGMVLWALAAQCDEPERLRPLEPLPDQDCPSWYREVVDICLDHRPQGRRPAQSLLRYFPQDPRMRPSYRQEDKRPSVGFRPHLDLINSNDPADSDPSLSTSHRSDKEYIDPQYAVTLDEVEQRRNRRRGNPQQQDNGIDFPADQVAYLGRDPTSTPGDSSYAFESSGSWIVGRSRGRSPVSSRRRRSSPCAVTGTSVTSVSCSPDNRSGRSAKVYLCDDTEDEVSHAGGEQQVHARLYAAAASSSASFSRSPVRPRSRSRSILRSRSRSLSPRQQRAENPACRGPVSLPSLASTSTLGFGPPVHQDSGFDEQMLEKLDVAGDDLATASSATTPRAGSGSHAALLAAGKAFGGGG